MPYEQPTVHTTECLARMRQMCWQGALEKRTSSPSSLSLRTYDSEITHYFPQFSNIIICKQTTIKNIEL